MSRTIPPCGTYSAYQRHVRRGETPDEACRAANAEQMRKYRARGEGWRASQRARDRAMQALTLRHRDEYYELYEAEISAAGGKP